MSRWESEKEMREELASNLDWEIGCELNGWDRECSSCPDKETCTA
jgi:hypothetical protein